MRSASSTSGFRGFPKLPRGHHGILVDRCLSQGFARSIDRFDRFRAAHLEQVYDNAASTLDVDFLTAAGDAGWAVFTQNPEMRRTPPEMQVILEHGTRVFTLANAQLPEAGKGMLFGRHLVSIRRRLERDGPCFWRLYEDRKSRDVK